MRSAALLLLLVAGCSRPQHAAQEIPPEPSAAAAAPAPADPLAGFELSVKRTGACYGCPRFAESVHIDERGQMRRGVEPKDERDAGTLSQADMLRIVRAFDGLADDYPAEVTDGSTYVLELRSAGRVKKIQHAFGNRHAPQALLDLEKLIGELTGLRMQ
jgi:hypothetical protein